ncbi:folate-binding protein [Sphingomonas sp. LY29]|uniref:CAF17-like 4Fe-4S cluster assembly/insertion protein YgfZ n=1 Tax=Sphingomonas sp. LY29 TaxID=3095341 RepID=UPI002D7A3D07|nr:folate-binding protein [Sphingomonas sp. LY29]WRP26990.1 folate-binding protein [Sphingomonas sp. LY29]
MDATTLPDRAVVRLTGEEVRSFLQGLVTADVSGALPVWGGLLSPQGKCLFDFIVWADGDDVLLDCEAAAADDLVKRLSIYRLRRAITIARDATLAVHWSRDGDAPLDPRLAALGHRWLAPATAPAGGWLAHRLSLGVCEGRAELGDLLWLECNADELHGVSFTKGCFVGQENTARMNWRSKVNRRLFVLPVGAAPDARVRVRYPEVGLEVAHLRIDEVPETAIRPEWMDG